MPGSSALAGSASNHDAGVPTRCPTAGRRPDRFCVDAAPSDQPGGHRVGVPHLPRAELVASPDGRGNLGHETPEQSSNLWIVGQPARTRDSFGHVGDHTVLPAPDLVAEDSRSPRPVRTDRSTSDDAACRTLGVRRRSLLDHEARAAREPHDECGVVKGARWPAVQPRGQRLEDAPAQPDRVAAGAQGKPVQITAASWLAAVTRGFDPAGRGASSRSSSPTRGSSSSHGSHRSEREPCV
jgi:hypothetical protein